MNQVGVGVVGCGFVGRGAHVPAFSRIEGSRLVAVADPDETRRSGVREKYTAKTYSDYADLIQDSDVNVVVVAVPTPLHSPVALAAIDAGKHVLCEMPLAVTMEAAEQMIDAAQRQGVVLMPSLTFRFTPTFVKVKELLASGVLGEPTAAIYRELIPASELAKQWPPQSWMWDLPKSGGPLFTLAVWSIDLLRWLFATDVGSVGSAVKYTKLEQFGGTLGYDCAAALGLANGMVGCMQYSGTTNSAGASNTLEVVGSSGVVLQVNANETVTLCGNDAVKTEMYVKEAGPRMWGHEQQDEHFVGCLLEGKEPGISPDDGLRAMQIAMQLADSSSRA